MRRQEKGATSVGQRLVLHGVPVEPNRAARAGAGRRRGGNQAARAAERGEDPRRLRGLPWGDAPGAGGGGGGDGAELPGAAAQAEHLHPGLHGSPDSKHR